MTFIYKLLILLTLFISSTSSFAQAKIATEERFQDLFITAGYSTAFGAALGAAVLGLSENPGSKLRYLAIGASVGFIAGSVLGTFIVFSPMISPGGTMTHIGLSTPSSSDSPTPPDRKNGSLVIRPILSDKDGSIRTLQADWLLAKF